MKYISGKSKTLLQQKYDIEHKFPFIKCNVRQNVLSCRGDFISTLTNNIYRVNIVKRVNKAPKVFILEPEIFKKHTYSDGSLCFYYYKNFKWNNNFWISDYHIPWTSAWIYFYEVWIITGEWYADEVLHDNTPKIFKE